MKNGNNNNDSNRLCELFGSSNFLGEDAIIRKEGDRLMIDSAPKSLLVPLSGW